MGTGRKYRKKPATRPVKCAREKRRRIKVQKARLVALGLESEKVEKLSNKDIRTLLRRPAKVSA